MTFARKLLLLTFCALLVRAGFLLLEPATQPIADERTWVNWAVENLVSPKVSFSPFRTRMIFYPPLYPYFIAVLYWLFGSLVAVKWAQVLVGVLLVPAVGRLGARVFGERAGLLAAAWVACYPDLVWYSAHFWSETLYLVVLWWAFERLLAADGAPGWRPAALAGVLWGLAVLVRETSLYLTPLVALWLLVRRGRQGRARAAAFFLAALLAIAPWTYRNWVVFGAFVPVSTAGGLNLWQGNAALPREEIYVLYDAVQGRVEQYRHAREMGIRAVIERQPWWIFEKLRDEMPRFWEADSLALIHIRRGAYDSVATVWALAAALTIVLPYLALLALFVAGLLRVPASRDLALLLGFLVFHNLLHVATHGFARYRMPVMPVLFLIAGHWLATRREGSPALTHRRLGLAAAVALALAFSVGPSLRHAAAHPAYGLVPPPPPGEEPPPP
ncbi:MAG: ArnT family glycosyltransferase [Vicinamibacteria bacterium]